MNTVYDVDAAWDDPFDHLSDRRAHPRIRHPFWAELSVRANRARGRYVGPAIVQEFSLTGARVLSKHDLRPGATVQLRIRTDDFPLFDLVAQEFTADCRVLRVQPMDGRRRISVLRFSDVLVNDMDFAHFVRQMETVREAFPSTPLAS